MNCDNNCETCVFSIEEEPGCSHPSHPVNLEKQPARIANFARELALEEISDPMRRLS